jgi:transcriptional regulator with XRE-family HTH domain
MERLEMKKARKNLKITLRDLQNMLKNEGRPSGYSYNYLSQIENGLRNPSPELAEQLEEILGVSKVDLVYKNRVAFKKGDKTA